MQRIHFSTSLIRKSILMQNIFHALSLCCFLLLFNPQNANAQCSATIEDTLVMSSGLQLAGVPTAGIPPFTFTWTINGSLSGSIIPTTINAAGDSLLIGVNDLFANYGCIYISLCITDSTGCTNCLLDTAFTEAIICYSGFQSDTLQPGSSLLTLANPAPEVVGISIATWEQDGQSQSTPIINGTGVITYNPSVYHPNGYKIPVCVQTFFFNTPNISCFYCDSVYIQPTLPSSIATQGAKLPYVFINNPINETLTIPLANDLKTEIALFDLNGRMLLKTEAVTEYVSLNTSSLASGTYLLLVRQAGFTKTEKIIKQ